MGDIVERIEDNLKDTPSRRIGDINILYLAGVVEDLKKKMDNGVTAKVDKIWAKINSMPCDVHAELIKKEGEIRKLELKALAKDMEELPKPNRVLINWLWAIVSGSVIGIVWLILNH